MTGLLESDTREVMNRARRTPVAGLPSTATDAFLAEFERVGLVDTMEGETITNRRAVAERNEAVLSITGRPFDAWVEEIAPQVLTRGTEGRSAADLMDPIIEEIRRRVPAQERSRILDSGGVEARSREIALEAEARASRIAGLSDSFWTDAAGVAGGMLRTTISPINLATLPVGFGGGGLARIMAREAALGFGVEGVQQPDVQARRAELGLESGFGPALENMTMAAGGAAAFSGGAVLLGKAWRRAFGRPGDPPPEIDSAMAALDRQELEAASAADSFRDTRSHREDLDAARASFDLDRQDRFRPVETASEPAAPPASDGPVVLPRVEPATLPATREGGDSVFVPGGGRIDVGYAVVEARDLITSHADDLARNEKFDPTLQPRQRDRAASRAQIDQMVRTLQPELLGRSPTADTGAPIIGPDMQVESGNARAIALRRLFRERATGPEAEAYRKFLQDQGLNLDGFEAPVLVRQRRTNLTDAQRREFVKAANERATAGLSPGERAAADADAIDDAMLALHEGGDASLSRNSQFVRRFMERAVAANDVAELVTADGRLSQAGEARIEAALAAKAYDDRKLLELFYEQTSPEARGLLGAMADAAPAWARLREAQTAGRISEGLDVTEELVAAIRLIVEARRARVKLTDRVSQMDLFGGEMPLRDLIVRAMFRDDNLTRAVGRPQMAARLNRYVEQAMLTRAGPGLFEDMEPVTASDIFRSIIAGDRASGMNAGGDMFADTADAAADGSADRAQAREVERIVAQRENPEPGQDNDHALDGPVWIEDPETGEPRAIEARELLDEADADERAAAELRDCVEGGI